MAVYRCYFLDAQSHIWDVEVLDASDDAEAIALAKQLHATKASPGFEVWERSRPVIQEPATNL